MTEAPINGSPVRPSVICPVIRFWAIANDDPQVFNYAMFDFRRLVAAPIVIVAGIVVEVVAIMRRPKKEK